MSDLSAEQEAALERVGTMAAQLLCTELRDLKLIANANAWQGVRAVVKVAGLAMVRTHQHAPPDASKQARDNMSAAAMMAALLGIAEEVERRLGPFDA
jgi:hypothetical protein